MDFNLSDEQNALKDSLAKFIDRDYGFEARWKVLRSPAGWSRAHWNQLAEIGLMALPVAEADGGLGGKGVDTMLVMEELGRGLVRRARCRGGRRKANSARRRGMGTGLWRPLETTRRLRW